MDAPITLTADIGELLQPGVPLVAAIVEGLTYSDGIGHSPRTDPPAWLVALRDARCETCEGDGIIAIATPSGGSHNRPCPDCHDGRLLHDVRVETGVINNRIGPNFGRSQTRTVHCLVDFAEVRALPTAGVCKIKDDHLDVYGTEPVLYVLGGHDGELTPAHVEALAAACGKPPADWPGMYGLVLTVAD